MGKEQLMGIVLAGGRSTRMGMDKSQIVYHEKAHKYHTSDLISSLGIPTFISQNGNQEINTDYKYIIDTFENIGPIGGIISAFNSLANGLIIVACDYPEVSAMNINFLLEQRDSSKDATILMDDEFGLIPTFGIFENKALRQLVENEKKGIYSIKACLESLKIKTIRLPSGTLKHINSSQEYRDYVKSINEN